MEPPFSSLLLFATLRKEEMFGHVKSMAIVYLHDVRFSQFSGDAMDGREDETGSNIHTYSWCSSACVCVCDCVCIWIMDAHQVFFHIFDFAAIFSSEKFDEDCSQMNQKEKVLGTIAFPISVYNKTKSISLKLNNF